MKDSFMKKPSSPNPDWLLMLFSEEHMSPSPEFVQLKKSTINVLGCAGWKGDGVSDVFQACLQSSDTRPYVSMITSTSWSSRDMWGESFQSQAEILSLGIQAEVTVRTCLAGREGVTASTAAGVTAGSSDTCPT